MIEFGKTLREARENAGLTISQLAANTRLMHQTVEDLENENFSRIAAPIYGRGFVKLYCEAVGIDPQPLVKEFMDIYNGMRTAVIHKQEVAPAAPTPAPTGIARQPTFEGLTPQEPVKPAKAATPAPEPPPVTPIKRLMPEDKPIVEPTADVPPVATIPRLTPRHAPADIVHAAPRTANPRPTHDIARDDEPVAPAVPPPKPVERPRFRTPEMGSSKIPKIPSRALRPIALLGAALVVVVLIGLGVRGIYRLAKGNPDKAAKDSAPVAQVEPASKPTTAQPATAQKKRKAIPVPALYID